MGHQASRRQAAPDGKTSVQIVYANCRGKSVHFVFGVIVNAGDSHYSSISRCHTCEFYNLFERSASPLSCSLLCATMPAQFFSVSALPHRCWSYFSCQFWLML